MWARLWGGVKGTKAPNDDIVALAQQGDAKAQYNLGEMYATGKGVAQNHKQAAAWFSKAAEQGDAAAQLRLGVHYEFGIGMPQDFKQAFTWISKAAEQGDAEAQLHLGVNYELGSQGGVMVISGVWGI